MSIGHSIVILISSMYYLNVFIDNCLDRHAEKNPDKPALIWEKDEPGTEEIVTYG